MATRADNLPNSAQTSSTTMPPAGRWRLDPSASRVGFRVKHFWHTVTVRGSFDRIGGEGRLAADGTIAGKLVIDAESVNTGKTQRDTHLRSADFFDVERHPEIVVVVDSAEYTCDGWLTMSGALEATGVREPVTITAQIVEATPDAVTVRASLTVDRTRFGMTWSPLGVAAKRVTGTATARFRRWE